MTRLKQLFNTLGRGVQSAVRYLSILARPLSFLSFKRLQFPQFLQQSQQPQHPPK